MSPVGFDSRGTYRSDGSEFGMVAAIAGKRTREREKSRGQGGEGEAGIVGGVSSLSSRGHGKGGPGSVRWAGRWPRRHGAVVPPTVAHSDEGFLQKPPRHCFFFSVLFLNLKTAPFGIYLRQQNIF